MRASWLTLLLALLLLGALFGAQVASAQSIRVMAFGDDWTAGRFNRVSYRYPLWFMLQDAGFDVDFVGRRIATREAPNLDWYPEYNTTFDRNHEGYDHTTTSQLIAYAESAAEMFQPHVVVLMAGSRDIYEFGAGGVSLAENNLPQIIQGFRNHVPDVTILLGQPPPWISDPDGSTQGTDHVAPLGAAVARVAQAENTQQSPVHLIDNYSGFNINTMLDANQQTFPNAAGEEWIAGNFLAVLEDVLPDIDPSGSNDFQINAGLNDAWYNPATAGQGVFVTVFPDIGMMFLAWFTYDSERPDPGVEAVLGEPGHRWLTAFGPYTANVAELEVELTSGGIFDSDQPPPQQQAGYGEILIEFSDCASASMTYDLFDQGLSGIVDLQRIANDNVAACEALNVQQVE